ncbi:hypothetical protein GZH47_06140 [Paenibacillus rhizovicinus]|uniref:Uncharacterized protein n=1 Tax=Paenibacillus rhizovicinus TaxID=2704463 RepID=A0A6C0NWD6_9BACL|nr:hypothetical protein [Paenibacillus rhizovicinus]QHW30468.1 hypothetical protein GZH47_06140 [Paenibacillus rhizovicinus]
MPFKGDTFVRCALQGAAGGIAKQETPPARCMAASVIQGDQVSFRTPPAACKRP